MFSCILDANPLRVRLSCCTYTTTPLPEKEEEMWNNLEPASRIQGKPHGGRGQLLSVSTLFLSNLDCKFFKKRVIMSSLHSTGHMWAPQVASAAAQTHKWEAETRWDGQGVQSLWHSSLLVTQGRMCHSWWHKGGHGTPGDTGEDVAPRICSHVHPAEHLLLKLLSTGAPGGTWEPDKENNLSNLLISMTLKQTTGSKVLEKQGQR